MKTIELNEQQIEELKGFLEAVIMEAEWSKTSQVVAQQIINKLEK